MHSLCALKYSIVHNQHWINQTTLFKVLHPLTSALLFKFKLISSPFFPGLDILLADYLLLILPGWPLPHPPLSPIVLTFNFEPTHQIMMIIKPFHKNDTLN